MIIQTAIDIEKIIIEEFQIKQKNIDISKLYFVRRNFVEKKVLYNKNNKSSPKDNDIKKIIKNNAINDFTISMHIFDLLHNCKNHTDLDILNDYLAWHYQNHLDRFCYLFSVPLKTDPLKMFDFEKIGNKIQSKIKTKRDGFKFIKSFDKNYAIMHAHYCILCHKTKKDSCRFGLKNLSGCPLDQKISIINFLYKNGHKIAALYVMLIDNPIPLLTGHRICNDCEKSCIFQKTNPS